MNNIPKDSDDNPPDTEADRERKAPPGLAIRPPVASKGRSTNTDIRFRSEEKLPSTPMRLPNADRVLHSTNTIPDYLDDDVSTSDFHHYSSLDDQVFVRDLYIKQMDGDGNCLFRALGDQLEGNPQNHSNHRLNVVNYMRNHRDHFEDFVEDNKPFDDHLRDLEEVGFYGGNGSIVAFARLHNLTVHLHQLNETVYEIHGGPDDSPGNRAIHIYHKGHYLTVKDNQVVQVHFFKTEVNNVLF